MQYFTGFFIMLTVMLVVIVSSRYLLGWIKLIITAYYVGISFLFITITNKINEKYADVIPVPDAYWDENTKWAFTVSNLLFVPFTGILIFIYIKWIAKVKSRTAKAMIGLSIIPAAILLFFCYTFFNFAYGYRP
ncbi:hypothetical protein QWY22_03525 [Planococcus liqunii]|uniref:hypothetical protein n=1 Tax=Planococcus liqunii TaxID=3058394 RepID=UPI002625E152|nr:hypothetical protein [Planococcus sp. N056]WKA51688.1 hypothetical protein QWY22_03525 [Planococcus sp. N056]